MAPSELSHCTRNFLNQPNPSKTGPAFLSQKTQVFRTSGQIKPAVHQILGLVWEQGLVSRTSLWESLGLKTKFTETGPCLATKMKFGKLGSGGHQTL